MADKGGRGDLLQFIRGNKNKHFATPTKNGNYNKKGASKKSGDGLATQAGGMINPYWIEWLQGWPIGSTALRPMSRRIYERWLNQQIGPWPDEPMIPRAKKGVANQSARIAAIGDSQVPKCAATAFLVLKRIFDEIDE